MIEVNLLPGGRKGGGLGGFRLAVPSFGGGDGGSRLPTDPYIMGAVAAGIVAIALMAWLYTGVSSDREDADVALAEAIQDSVRFADLIGRQDQLVSRQDSIARRVAVIQEIDADRYVWPHLLDEVGRALPDYTWLRELIQLQDDPLQVRLSGRAGSNFAITTFMRQLEASPFLRGVNLERSEQMVSEGDGQDIVYGFDLTLSYEAPSLDYLETVPLFENEISTQTALPPDEGN